VTFYTVKIKIRNDTNKKKCYTKMSERYRQLQEIARSIRESGGRRIKLTSKSERLIAYINKYGPLKGHDIVYTADRDTIRNEMKQFVSDKGKTMCKQMIGSKEYWDDFATESSVQKTVLMLSAYKKNQESGKLFVRTGFSCQGTTCTKNHTGWYVDLICSHMNAGGPLLLKLIQLAKTSGIKSITLSAMPDVITFYLKYGFVIGDGKCISSKESTINQLKLHTIYEKWKNSKSKSRNRVRDAEIRNVLKNINMCATSDLCEGNGTVEDIEDSGVYLTLHL
jgi:hypothetical protein